MKKFTKTAAIALALLMSANVFAACADNSKKESDKKDKKPAVEEASEDEGSESEEETKETTEATTEATKATEATEVIEETEVTETEGTTEETTEETEETEEPEETTVETTEETTVETTAAPAATSYAEACQVVDDEDQTEYDAYMTLVDTINESNPDKTLFYQFDYKSINVKEAGDVDKVTTYKFEGEKVEVAERDAVWFAGAFYSYDEIKKLPIITSTLNARKPVDDSKILSSLPDGTYYGSMTALSLDGTQALVVLGKPIILTADEYNSLKSGDHISIADNDPYFLYDLTISEDYEEGSDYMFDGDYIWFRSLEDGTYRLEGANDTIIRCNCEVAFVDIAPDCKIEDTFAYLFGNIGGYEDAPNTITQTVMYHGLTCSDYGSNWELKTNGWIETSAVLEPVVIENNTIVDMVLGWR